MPKSSRRWNLAAGSVGCVSARGLDSGGVGRSPRWPVGNWTPTKFDGAGNEASSSDLGGGERSTGEDGHDRADANSVPAVGPWREITRADTTDDRVGLAWHCHIVGHGVGESLSDGRIGP